MMLDELVTWAVIAVAIAIPLIYFLRYRRKVSAAEENIAHAFQAGLTEPVSLHPRVDPNRCIATGACIEACPEKGILGIVGGRAELVSPTRCIGHGACLSACPVEAISLVFGTERRGVEIPTVSETFETNVHGVFIAGELGGMGLIRNAITQGSEAVDYIAKSLGRGRHDDIHDLAIIGAGPAGLAATLQAKKLGLRSITLEQEEDIGGAVLSYPRQKLVMSHPMVIPLYGPYKRREFRKEELMDLWQSILAETGIKVNCREKVKAVERNNGHFVIRSSGGTYAASKVLLAIGRRGTPRRLGVKGERSTKVAYKLLDPEQYQNRKLLVVGGGDSAVEAALSLGEQEGTTVALSYRKAAFSRIKEKNGERIEAAIDSGWVTTYMESEVTEIGNDTVTLTQRGNPVVLPNDFVFVFIGGELPTGFLRQIGIEVETKFGVG